MFNNIIYFIVVLLVFNLGGSSKEQSESLLYSISMLLALWFFLAASAWTGFKRLARLYERGMGSGYARMYNRLMLRLSILSVFVFSLDVFSFNLKYWVEHIPLAGNVFVLQSVAAIILFIFYLSTIWYFAHRSHNLIFGTNIGRRAFILWNIRLNIPVIFPWLILALVLDLVAVSPWPELEAFLDRPAGLLLFFVIFLCIAMIFLPVLVTFFWGCRPIGNSSKADGIRLFLMELGVRYRALVSWPLLEGKMLTAGVMGVIPRYRYIMVTESLMDVLTPSELNAVMAHEAGHAKYNHQLLLSLFFLGYLVLMLGLFDPEFYFTVMAYLASIIPGDIISGNIFVVFSAVPILATMIIYFRFIMGFFMRHFERQADTYAAVTIGDPSPIISSLEKIALLSGKIRDVPSWHHFSIRQRVDFLADSYKNPGMINRHKRLILSSFVIYLGLILSLAYLLYMTPVKKYITNDLNNRYITEQIEKRPKEAVRLYEKKLSLDYKQPDVLNNLAWLLVTTRDPDVRDIKRGLRLAKEAVALEKSPVILDTLAEAYWVNGDGEMAVRTIKEAIRLDDTGNPYYRKQLDKFSR